MPRPTAPAGVVRSVAAGVSRLVTGNLTGQEKQAQVDDLAGFYAEHTDVRHPFMPTGDTPLRTRAELRRHFAEAAGTQGIDRFEPVGEVHETADPEVVVFEFSYVGSADGSPFTVPCVFVTRVREGLIVESRDYGDHVGMARVFGRLDELAAALAAESR
jgi:uncharacterized protein